MLTISGKKKRKEKRTNTKNYEERWKLFFYLLKFLDACNLQVFIKEEWERKKKEMKNKRGSWALFATMRKLGLFSGFAHFYNYILWNFSRLLKRIESLKLFNRTRKLFGTDGLIKGIIRPWLDKQFLFHSVRCFSQKISGRNRIKPFFQKELIYLLCLNGYLSYWFFLILLILNEYLRVNLEI